MARLRRVCSSEVQRCDDAREVVSIDLVMKPLVSRDLVRETTGEQRFGGARAVVSRDLVMPGQWRAETSRFPASLIESPYPQP